jgi:glycosyltransferase involved in cell wall biosynthesis
MLSVPESLTQVQANKGLSSEVGPEQPASAPPGDAQFAVVVPHLNEDPAGGRGLAHLRLAVDGILAQTVETWRLIVVDDASPSPAAHAHLDALAAQDPRIVVLREPLHRGPGHCRNVGIAYAWSEHIPVVVFNDADDISHPRRLEVIGDIFARESTTSVVYSHFDPIDQDGEAVARADLTPSIAEILEAIAAHPPEGADVWIDIATRTGYVNLTSATSVRTRLAYSYPFPEELVSEDFHTWLRYSAAGGEFRYTPAVPTRYRVRLSGGGSASRDRVGGPAAFYRLKLRNDLDGFERAMELAIARGTFRPDDRLELTASFLVRLATSLAEEAQADLAQWATDRAQRTPYKRVAGTPQ